MVTLHSYDLELQDAFQCLTWTRQVSKHTWRVHSVRTDQRRAATVCVHNAAQLIMDCEESLCHVVIEDSHTKDVGYRHREQSSFTVCSVLLIFRPSLKHRYDSQVANTLNSRC